MNSMQQPEIEKDMPLLQLTGKIPLLDQGKVLKVEELQNEISLHSAYGMKPRALAPTVFLSISLTTTKYSQC